MHGDRLVTAGNRNGSRLRVDASSGVLAKPGGKRRKSG